MSASARIGVLLRMGEVAGHVLGETLVAPVARAEADVPRDHSMMTPQWLTAVLCKDAPGGEVLSFRCVGGSVGTSTRQAIELTLNEAAARAGVPRRLFVKSTKTFGQRMLLGLSDVIYGEVGFFGCFRGLVDIEAPKGYFASVDPGSLRSAILMEDVVASKGAQFNTGADAVSKADMEQLLANFARLHARFWAAPDLTTTHPKLRDTLRYLHDVNRLIDMCHRATVGTRRSAGIVPDALLGRTDEIWAGVLACAEAAQGRPMTLLHGDAHIAQTYRTRDGRMGLADWQVLLRGPWAWDVSYIVSTGLEIEDRRRWEKDLIAFYVDALAEAGGPRLAFDEAWLAYRQNVLYAYIAWAFTIGRSVLQPMMQPIETTKRLVARTSHAIADLDAIAAAQAA